MAHFAVFSFSSLSVFFFNDTATTEIYTLSLHDALPIWERGRGPERFAALRRAVEHGLARQRAGAPGDPEPAAGIDGEYRPRLGALGIDRSPRAEVESAGRPRRAGSGGRHHGDEQGEHERAAEPHSGPR